MSWGGLIMQNTLLNKFSKGDYFKFVDDDLLLIGVVESAHNRQMTYRVLKAVPDVYKHFTCATWCDESGLIYKYSVKISADELIGELL